MVEATVTDSDRNKPSLQDRHLCIVGLDKHWVE